MEEAVPDILLWLVWWDTRWVLFSVPRKLHAWWYERRRRMMFDSACNKTPIYRSILRQHLDWADESPGDLCVRVCYQYRHMCQDVNTTTRAQQFGMCWWVSVSMGVSGCYMCSWVIARAFDWGGNANRSGNSQPRAAHLTSTSWLSCDGCMYS